MADAVIQLRDLQARFSELQTASREKDAELRDLREIAEAASALQTQDVQTAKIIDLSKKNRLLVLQVEKEKAKASKLQADLNALGGAKAAPVALDPSAVEGIARKVVEQAAEAAEAATKQAEMWKDRCQQQTNKMSQLEQKVFALEIEAKKLQRALVREVGEEVPLSKVVDEGSSDWKGRREQIIALRHQVQTLKAAQGLAPEGRHDAAAKKVMAKVTGTKNAELELLRAELAQARQEADAAKTKAEGALSRRKIVESELGSIKEKVSVVLSKTHNDDRLIAALRAELALVRKNAAEPVVTRPPRLPVEEDDELWRELSALRRRCAEQKAQVERYEATVSSLNDRLAAAHAAAASGGSGAGGANAGAAASSRGGTPPWSAGSTRLSGGAGGGAGGGRARAGTGRAEDGLDLEEQESREDVGRQAGSSSGRGVVQGVGGGAGGLVRMPSVRGPTPVEVRDAALDPQLRVAQVEILRLQELVQLLRNRVQELEDELADQEDR